MSARKLPAVRVRCGGDGCDWARGTATPEEAVQVFLLHCDVAHAGERQSYSLWNPTATTEAA